VSDIKPLVTEEMIPGIHAWKEDRVTESEDPSAEVERMASRTSRKLGGEGDHEMRDES
jgi:hypothetical protein